MEIKEYKKNMYEKLEKVESILRNCKRQKEALEEENTEKFLELVEKREAIIDEMELIEKSIKTMGKYNDNEVDEVLQKISERAVEIQEMDKYNMNNAIHLKDEFAKRIKEMKAGKSAINNGYRVQEQFAHGSYFNQTIGNK